MIEVATTVRGLESVRGDGGKLVPQKVNGRSRMLPANPHKTAKILREQRGAEKKATAVAARMRAKMRSRHLIG
jgi:hypothetical protein